jgi:hypothetical protein
MATYYVSDGTGSDANSGASNVLAWETIQKALDTAVAGDVVRVMNDGVYLITAPIDADTNSGTAASPIRFESWNAGGTAQEDGVIIRANASIASILELATAIDALEFTGFDFDANSNATYCISNNVDGSDGHTFTRCTFRNATSHGVRGRGTSTFAIFVACAFHSNGGSGYASAANGRGPAQFYGCSIYDNASHGVLAQNSVFRVFMCQVYRNGGDGIVGSSTTSDNYFIVNCTFFDNDGDGVDLSTSGALGHFIFNTTCVNNGGYGFNLGSALGDKLVLANFNHTHNNTSGASDVTLPGTNQTGDPLFADAANGDFTPQTGSPLIDNGLNNLVIGAKGNLDSGGGGGGGTLIGSAGMTGGWTG